MNTNTSVSSEPDASAYYVWFGQGDCKRVDTLEEARELRDSYLSDGDFSTITNDRNEAVS